MVCVRYDSVIKHPFPVHPLNGIFFLFIVILAGDLGVWSWRMGQSDIDLIQMAVKC